MQPYINQRVTVTSFTAARCDKNPIWQIRLKFPECFMVTDRARGLGSSLSGARWITPITVVVSRVVYRRAGQWVKRELVAWALLFVAAAAQAEYRLSRCVRTNVVLKDKLWKLENIFETCG